MVVACVSVWSFGFRTSSHLQSLPDQPFSLGGGAESAEVAGTLSGVCGGRVPVPLLSQAAGAVMGGDLPPSPHSVPCSGFGP